MGITGADSGGLLDMWRGDIYRWLAETPNTPTSLRYQAKRRRGDTRLTTLAVNHELGSSFALTGDLVMCLGTSMRSATPRPSASMRRAASRVRTSAKVLKGQHKDTQDIGLANHKQVREHRGRRHHHGAIRRFDHEAIAR